MTTTVTMGRQGRIVVPADVRRELGLAEGDQLDLTVRNGRLELKPRLTPQEAIRLLRGLLRDASSTSLVDELIAERRAEAARE